MFPLRQDNNGYNTVVGRKPARRRYRSARRHFRDRQCAAALRAFTAAELHLSGKVKSLDAAAASCGSNPAYVRGAITILHAEDAQLRERVLTGEVSLLIAARSASGAAKLVAAWRTASAADRVTLARTVGPTILFDSALVPAL
jgi:pyrroline-5-carboxylate reductase